MKSIRNFFVCLLLTNAYVLLGTEIADLIPLRGGKYIKARDEILENNANISDTKSDDPRMGILLDILREHKKHPDLFAKLPELMKKGYVLYERESNQGRWSTGRTFIAGAAANFIQQGIEEKEYFKSESSTGNFGDLKDVKYTQTDEEVVRAKELNRAARLAVIEYLWKIADDRRTIFELTDLLKDRHEVFTQFGEPILVVFEDILMHSPDDFDPNSQEQGHTGTARCSEIFFKKNYKKALPSLKRKFDACYKARNFADCFALGYTIKELGDENDKKRMEDILPLLKKMKVEVIEEWNKKWEAEEKANDEEEQKNEKNADKVQPLIID